MTADNTCQSCGQAITVTTRNPNRRYCSPRCRKAAWQTQRRNRKTVEKGPDTANGTVANDVGDAVGAANGTTRCPNCRHELAVIAVVIPADAAHVHTPEVIT